MQKASAGWRRGVAKALRGKRNLRRERIHRISNRLYNAKSTRVRNPRDSWRASSGACVVYCILSPYWKSLRVGIPFPLKRRVDSAMIYLWYSGTHVFFYQIKTILIKSFEFGKGVIPIYTKTRVICDVIIQLNARSFSFW